MAQVGALHTSTAAASFAGQVSALSRAAAGQGCGPTPGSGRPTCVRAHTRTQAATASALPALPSALSAYFLGSSLFLSDKTFLG